MKNNVHKRNSIKLLGEEMKTMCIKEIPFIHTEITLIHLNINKTQCYIAGAI